jgi:hypothetical protein
MSTALLQTTYFGPIQWYQKLYRYDQTLIEQYDSYQKQTYRNRCVIATANGLQALTVPVEHNVQRSMFNVQCKDLRISDHNQWRRVHWNALQSAYSESPFFDYYADDIRPFFEKKYEFLVDFNEAIRQTVCDLLDIQPKVEYTSSFLSPLTSHLSSLDDFREVINAKHPQADADFQPRRYWQVFEGKHGFQANLSILDLLFNMGNEAIFYL